MLNNAYMKKLLLIFILAFALNSCTSEGNSPRVSYELIAIKRCIMPDSFVLGETYDLQMFYEKPTSCHYYKGIYFEKEGNTRIVAIQSGLVESNDCITYDYNNPITPGESSAHYSFKVTEHQAYIFKFWTGRNEQGENTYYEVKVPVEN